jgi:hypothetical protein
MRIRYTGSIQSTSGELAIITGVQAQNLLSGGAGGTPMNVDDLFTIAQHVTRFPLDDTEVKWQPDLEFGAGKFYINGESPLTIGDPAAAATALNANYKSQPIDFIGFAWRNVPASTDVYRTVDLYRVDEWMPAAEIGISRPDVEYSAPGTFERVINEVRKDPLWYIESATSVASKMAKLVFGGNMRNQRRMLTN